MDATHRDDEVGQRRQLSVQSVDPLLQPQRRTRTELRISNLYLRRVRGSGDCCTQVEQARLDLDQHRLQAVPSDGAVLTGNTDDCIELVLVAELMKDHVVLGSALSVVQLCAISHNRNHNSIVQLARFRHNGSLHCSFLYRQF